MPPRSQALATVGIPRRRAQLSGRSRRAERPAEFLPLPRLAVDAREAARLFGVSRAAWLKWRAAGRLPRPRRLGRRVLWDTRELAAWWAAGAPPPEDWERRQRWSA
jgi:predicted DNA-binding transcriptional regulator AlpA